MQSAGGPLRVNLTRQCLASIQRYILDHHLGPGDKLPSLQQWAEMLGVSVRAVREAMQALQALGLVDIQHGRGIFVRSVEDNDFLDFLVRSRMASVSTPDVVQARAMLELVALEACIANATPQDIAELEEILDLYRENLDRQDGGGEYHRLFHYRMLQATGSQLLYMLGVPLWNTYIALGATGRLPQEEQAQADPIESHEAYLQAIRDRDFGRTRELVNEHLLGLCAHYHVFPFGDKSCYVNDEADV